MFQQRLVREDDADLILECFAFLIRRWGLPERPAVPSPLHKSQGLETLYYGSGDTRSVPDWAQDNLANVLYGAGVQSDDLTLSESPAGPGRLTEKADAALSYDPARAAEPGHYVSELMLQLAARRMADFEPGFVLGGPQKALILLSACAFMRQGFALIHCQSMLQNTFSSWGVPARAIEAQLLFAACLGLTVRRQTPEQIIATYGSLMSPTVRRKVRPACRQIETYAPEVKLLQTLADPTYRAAQDRPRGRIRPELTSQPQRISWT
ncbi:hypothetical protein ACFFUB_08290 [Algimonas porphyrae]|uniref:Uncharacterized protein n=1 Tax=Algimonas porphyrae TaxID=1128113 RepID=A0ABQ5V517_9PROT|nr:hypothetical protein [Algimonas porphyrae]GLQ22044.1 hypothetical protein GCM10007854_29990 [Algimonas porphyrae]